MESASDSLDSKPAVTLPVASVELAVSLSSRVWALLYSVMKSLIAVLIFAVSVPTVMLTLFSAKAVTLRPGIPELSSVSVLEVLTNVLPPLTL